MEYHSVIFPDDIKVEQRFGQRITHDKKNPIHWLPLDIHTTNLNKPTILCFGGISTTNDRDANYVAKFIQRIMKLNGEANLISIIHSHYNDEKSARYFDIDPEEHYQNGISEAFEIVDALFLPLLLDDEGNRLLVQDACKNIRNINIFAHCYGHFSTVSYIEEALREVMPYFSYTPDEIAQILKQVFVVSYEAGDIFKTGFTNVNISSIASELWSDVVLNLPQIDLSNVKMSGNEKEQILASQMYQTGAEDLVVRFFQNNKYLLFQNENMIEIFTSNLTKDKTDHDLSTLYEHQDGRFSYYTNELGKTISQTIATVLKIALQNSIKNKSEQKFTPIDISKLYSACEDSLKIARTHFGVVADLDFD